MSEAISREAEEQAREIFARIEQKREE